MVAIPDWLEKAAKVVFDHANKECDEKRKFMVPIWKRAEYYWNDIQDIYLDAVSADWRTFDQEAGETELDAIEDSNKIINNYRAEGESIIAAATIGNLFIRFFPENADDPADLDKARSFSDKADYVQRVNSIKELRRKAFTIRWNQGLVASYTYFKRDKKRFGTFKKDIIGLKKVAYVDRKCLECGEVLAPTPYEEPEELANAIAPQIPEVDPNAEIPPEEPVEEDSNACPVCGGTEFDESIRTEDVPYKSSEEKRDRGCATIELYSPLQIKIPHYATKVSDINYIILETEIHYATARAIYPSFASKIHPNQVESVESLNRVQADNYATLSSNSLVTVSRFWCKPDLYNVLEEGNTEFSADKLLKKFPDGAFFTYVGDVLVSTIGEDMDEHWSFVESSLDTHVYCRSLGNSRIPIQDMENDLVFIINDTIRHQIGETYYDSRVIDRRSYKDHMTRPGDMTPVNNVDGRKSIADFFHSTKSASLSQEVNTHLLYLQTKGQFVSGALPSLYGGMFEAGSKTLGVYDQSRQQALQRVAIPANGIDDFLATTIHKATEIYDKNMDGDEIYSVEAGDSYRNVTLRKSAPGAKIARVEVVKSEQFPVTWEQKRAFVMEMLEKGLDPVTQTVFSTENISLLSQIIGIPELKVPGVADRNKQLHEIQALLQGEPQPDPNFKADPNMLAQLAATGQQPPQAPFIPTIMPDPDVDNNGVHIDTIISWAVSPEGIREKINNPKGYANVIMHLTQHKSLMAMQQPTEIDPKKGGDNPPKKEEMQ